MKSFCFDYIKALFLPYSPYLGKFFYNQIKKSKFYPKFLNLDLQNFLSYIFLIFWYQKSKLLFLHLFFLIKMENIQAK